MAKEWSVVNSRLNQCLMILGARGVLANRAMRVR